MYLRTRLLYDLIGLGYLLDELQTEGEIPFLGSIGGEPGPLILGDSLSFAKVLQRRGGVV
jgi:hypothetical protein